MWFRRDLRLAGQPGADRGLRGRCRGAAVRRRPGAVGPVRSGAPRLPRRVAGRARPVPGRPARRPAGRPGEVLPRSPPRPARGACTWPRTSVPTALAGTTQVAEALDGAGVGLEPARLAVRRRAGARAQGGRHPLPGLLAVPAGLGRARLACTGRPAGEPDLGRAAVGRRSGRRLPRGHEPPQAGEDAALAAWAKFRDERLAGYAEGRDIPGSDGASGMSTYLKWGEIHPRTHARRPRTGRRAPRRTAGSSPGASSTPTSSGTTRERPPGPPPGVRRDRVRRAGRAVRGLEGRADRLPDRRRRHAGAARDRSDAQPRPDGGGELPRQGPARLVAARRPHFMEWLADGDLPSNQHNWQWVAGVRHRPRAVLPGLQPHDPGPQVRPGRRPTSAAGCRSSPTCLPDRSTSRRTCRATPTRSWTTPAERKEALARYERITSRRG